MIDTSRPEIELIEPERVTPERNLGLRVRIHDLHSGAAALNYRLRLLSNGCLARTVSGSLTGFIPDDGHELAIITVPVPADLRSGTLAIDELEVADRAATPNKTALDPSQICIGSCADNTPPNVTVSRVRWVIDGQTARALSPGDGVHPGAQLEVTVQASDEHSNVRQIWAQIDGATPTPPADEEACPGLSDTAEQTFQLQAPEGPDGQAFTIVSGAFDDVGAGGDHNIGLAETFALELNDDVPPMITNITLLNSDGAPAQPAVGGTVRLGVSATETFGSFARIQLRIDDQTGTTAAESEVERFDPVQPELSAYASPTVLQLPNPNTLRATDDWTARVTLWDDATPPNAVSATLGFVPLDGQPPRLTGVTGAGALNLSDGRAATARLTGDDAARFIASASLVDVVVNQTGVSAQPVSTALPAETASANAVAVSIPIPINAKEGSLSAIPRLTDDSGNHTDGQRVQFNLVDDVPPELSAVFNPNVLLPGGPVRLEVSATDANSTGIARLEVGNVQHITWDSQAVVNQATVVFTGTVADNPGAIGAGLPLEAVVTATDQAAGANQRTVRAAATLRDQAGPIITVLEVTEGTVGGSATLRIQARDLNGVVAQTSFATTINRFDSNNQIQRTETVNYATNDRLGTQEQSFSVAIPNNAQEGQYSILFTATDSEGNESQFTATGNLRLAVVDRTAPESVSITSLPNRLETGGSSAVRVTATDRSSGIASLRLSAAELNQTLTHNCNNASVCTHTFALPVASNTAHELAVALEVTATDGSSQSNSTTPAATQRQVRDVEAPEQVAITNPLPVQVDTGATLQLQVRGFDVSSGLASATFTLPCGSAGPFSFNNAPKNLISINQAWQVPSDCDAVGVQDVSVRLTDVAGNTSQAATLSLNIVDTTNPAVTFRSPPSIATTGASFNVPVRLSDAGSGAARLTLGSTCGTVSDGGVITINNAPAQADRTFSVSGLQACPPGAITLTLGGQDAAGNAAASATHAVTLRDDEAPSASLLLSSTTIDVDSSVTLTATTTDTSSGLASVTFTVPCGTISAPHPVSLNGETTEQSVQRTWTVPPECRTLGSQNVSVAVADQSTHSADGSASVQVTLRDQQAPTVAWDNPPAQVNLSQGATLGVTVSDASSGVASVSFSLAQQAQGTLAPTSRSIAGAPTSGSTTTTLSLAPTLTHGTNVTVQTQAQDVAGNNSALVPTTVSVVDDIAPISISAVPQLSGNRQLGGNRFAVAAGETVAIELSATDPNSGIETAQLSVLVGGNTTVEGQTAGNSQVVFTTTINYGVPGGLSDGAEIVITPQANDVSDATGLTAGAAITLVVDATPPTSAPSLIAPAAATTFGTPRSFHCLSTGDAALSGLRGTADTVAVNVQISPLPAGFPADGQNLNTEVNPGGWTLVPQGFSWANHTEYTVTLRGRDAVGNQQVDGVSFTLRGDTQDGTWTATPSFATSATNRDSGLADYQPVMTGTRSITSGGAMLVVGQFACGTQSNQNDSTPADATYTISEPTTLSLGQSNSLSCAWSLTESYCARTRVSSGTTTFSKPNAAPTNPTNLRVDGDSGSPATASVLWPSLRATASDAFDAATNQISQSRSVEVQVYQGNGNTVIWNSGLRSVDLGHGADYVTAFPRWRPPEAGIVAGAGDAVRRGNELYWFGRGAAPSVYILDLDENRWTNTVESMAPGSAAVAWSEDDAVMLLPSGVWLRVTADGEHLTGADAGGTITWTNLGNVTNFPECASVRLTSLGADSSRALLWCRSDANFTTDHLQTYELSEPVNPNVEWTAAVIVTAPLLIVDEHFQVARLGASDDYRVVPGAGNNVQVLGGRLVPNGFVPAWSAPLAGTGDNLNLSSGASVVGTGDTSYLVLSGGNDAWRAAAAADPANDTLSSANLPGALTVNGGGQHLAAGDGTHDAVALVWHATHGLRPVVWNATDNAFVTPPDPQSSEAALSDGSSYTWALRFTDQGGLTGSYPVPPVQRHDFTVSIP